MGDRSATEAELPTAGTLNPSQGRIAWAARGEAGPTALEQVAGWGMKLLRRHRLCLKF
jgi:hypothetical protein